MKNIIMISVVCFFVSCAFNVCASDKKSSRPTNENGVWIYSGFLTGLDFINMKHIEKHAYACGIIDGILVSPCFGAEEDKIKKFNSCISGMSNYQVAAIISKYLEDHPEKWHEPLHFAVVNAFSEICDIVDRNNYCSPARK